VNRIVFDPAITGGTINLTSGPHRDCPSAASARQTSNCPARAISTIRSVG
jgi:hypothetical protein